MLIRSIAPKLSFNSKINSIDYSTQELNNSVPLYFIEDKNKSICGIEIVFAGGKIDETTNGASFFSTNLLKSGIEGFDSNAINDFFELRGAFVQVQAGLDFNSLSLYCISDKLDETLPFFLKLFNSPTFPKHQVDKLVKKKEQELDINDKKSNYWATKLLKKSLFNNHPYGKVLTKKELKLITSEHLIKHWNTYSGNSIKFITAVGNFNLNNVSDELDKGLAKLISPPPSAKKKNNETYTSPSFARKNLPKNGQSSLKIGAHCIDLVHPDYTALSFSNSIFGGYFGSRLMQSIREDKGLTYGINSAIIHLAESSYVQISADIKIGVGKEVIDLIKDELYKLTNTFIEDHEISKVKNYLIGEYKSSSETIFDKMSKVKFLKIHNLPNSYYIDHFSSMLEVNSEKIQESLKNHFTTELFNIALVE